MSGSILAKYVELFPIIISLSRMEAFFGGQELWIISFGRILNFACGIVVKRVEKIEDFDRFYFTK